MQKISLQETKINNLKSELKTSQKNYLELRESMTKKMSSLEMILQNQLKIGAEDSFANYINLNEDMNFSVIKKNAKGRLTRQRRKRDLRVQRAGRADGYGQKGHAVDGQKGGQGAAASAGGGTSEGQAGAREGESCGAVG